MYSSSNVYFAKRAWPSILTADITRFSHCCSMISPKYIYLQHELPAIRSLRSQVNQGVLVEEHSQNNEVNYPALSSEKPDHGNKGRVPWNKGVKHSEETRAKIGHRTKEALMDPKVRKKMSDAPRSISDQTRERIRKSVFDLWNKRLERKRAAERLLCSWSESIALAAKAGTGSDQQELEWDSYEILQKEIALLRIRHIENMKNKERNHLRTERAAVRKAKLEQKRREREEMKKIRGETAKRITKSDEVKEEKLKERLLKIHKKKSRISRVSGERTRNWENFDLNSVKEALLHNEVSLAGQISDAKSNIGQEKPKMER